MLLAFSSLIRRTKVDREMNGYIMGVWMWERIEKSPYLFAPIVWVVLRRQRCFPHPPQAAQTMGASALTDTHKKRSGGEMPSCLSVASSFKRTYSLETAVSAPCHVKQAGEPTMPNLERVV